jgi:hypothetical protein
MVFDVEAEAFEKWREEMRRFAPRIRDVIG